jgi:DNA mismatch endonuclease (patch repair protein)
MTDCFSSEERHRIMSRIKGKNTEPERRVRSFLHEKGFRFRLHRSDLPGSPDIVLPRYRLAVFVHGCFWHRHRTCSRGTSTPQNNREFLLRKFQKNVSRDLEKERALRSLGWKVLVLWECEIRSGAYAKALLSELRDTQVHQQDPCTDSGRRVASSKTSRHFPEPSEAS